jgi:hypothetical protein
MELVRDELGAHAALEAASHPKCITCDKSVVESIAPYSYVVQCALGTHDVQFLFLLITFIITNNIHDRSTACKSRTG